MNNINRANIYNRTFENEVEQVAIPGWFYTLAFVLIILVIIVR